ncbi:MULTISPECIES: hypothetical protein [Stappiaceae]|jgi:hypothetical protein|uniref:hypothetical protein n=1 Tax=Stappiaceae TaxID=2821832 RepID=UPI0010DEB098|nr:MULTISPECIES: hypothetical protein [Stappiaceae]MBO9424007.1 hypothetical protein [Labrenzia sp. R4_1]
MNAIFNLMSRKETVNCTVEINNTFDQLGAHLRFDNGVVVHPGDEVFVHGAPVSIPYGESQRFRREATIRRAGPLERAWTRATGDFEMMELCEFSFTERALS